MALAYRARMLLLAALAPATYAGGNMRTLFDWLVVSHVIEHNPAHAVRGRNIRRTKAKRRSSTGTKRGALIAAIDTSSLTGLRDRALIGVMAYTPDFRAVRKRVR
jgi:site-specific recombinase XerD